MGVWKLCFVLLLPLSVCFQSEETLVKIIGREPDATRICTNETLNITLILCKISTERSRGEECQLKYKYGQDFVHGCNSTFTLMKENQTVFLHLNSLTPEDSGNYTCECTNAGGTYILHLSVTVEGEHQHKDDVEKGARSLTKVVILLSSTGAATVIIVTAFILGFIYWIKSHGGYATSEKPQLSVHQTTISLDEDDPDDPYISLQQPTNDLYQTITLVQCHHDTKTNSARSSETVLMDNQELDPNCEDYENM